MSREQVLFLSRDRGSVQTLVPVVEALRDHPRIKNRVRSLRVSCSLFDERGIAAEPIDEVLLAADPVRCIDDVLEEIQPALVVSGSSPAHGVAPETPEQHLILAARARRIPTIGILDYWGMYRERFADASGRLDRSLVPDVLCALDTVCRDDLIRFGIPTEQIRVTHNPWLDSLAAAFPTTGAAYPISRDGGWRILFVSQPLAEMGGARAWGYDQEDVLGGLLDALPVLDASRKHRVAVWYHPLEDVQRWRNVGRKARPWIDVSVSVERGSSFLQAMDFVVTSHSTVAYEALHCGTPCVFYRPGAARLDPLVTERVRLSPTFTHIEALRVFLRSFDSVAERVRIASLRKELLKSRVFFSDGKATERVLDVIFTAIADGAQQFAT